MLTATGLVSATAAAVAIGSGRLHLAIGLLVLTGLHDLLDGPVAKASGTSSMRGAFFDSVTDRVADALLLGGVGWFLLSTRPGHLVLLPFAILAVTSLVSYQRAKAESLGLSAKGGLMERAERMILLGVGLLSASFLVPVLWVMLALTLATAAGRFVKVWRLAGAPVTTAVARRSHRPRTAAWGERRRASHSPARWRARRQGELASRSGRTWRARHARQGIRQRASARRAG
jgi:CDP-diacylglycerol--glycerol-3-phosphate 3-phosphatidyltransferase